MHGAQQRLWMHVDSLQKCIWTRACAPMQRCSSFLVMEAIANLFWVLREHCAGCRLPLALLPPALVLAIYQLTLFTKNPSKSAPTHDAVAAVVLHKHHLIIRVGAGLIHFVYGSHLRWATGVTSSKSLFPPSFGASLFEERTKTPYSLDINLITTRLSMAINGRVVNRFLYSTSRIGRSTSRCA